MAIKQNKQETVTEAELRELRSLNFSLKRQINVNEMAIIRLVEKQREEDVR